MKKQLLLAATVATISLGAIGTTAAYAATNNSAVAHSGIVDKLATKFGLKKADVQAVFDEQHATHEAKMMEKLSDKLAAGVKAGTITQTQSDAIIAKLKEIQTMRGDNRTTFEQMTDAERKTTIDAQRTALEKWITDNKIPNQFARLLHGRKHGMHNHSYSGMMDDNDDMSPPSGATN